MYALFSAYLDKEHHKQSLTNTELNNEDKTNVRGPGRTNKSDWINAATQILVEEGIDQIKVLSLSNKLNCARSSFYWYFKNRSELLDSLLRHWEETNTPTIVNGAQRPAPTINMALARLHLDWLNDTKFDQALDFAIRDWGRRSPKVRKAMNENDAYRIRAITHMFCRFDFTPADAEIRARIVYFTQIGYISTERYTGHVSNVCRSRRFLNCLSGIQPSDEESELLAKSLLKERMEDTVF